MSPNATAQTKKDKSMAELVAARDSILSAASALPMQKQDQIFLGTWSARDFLAHLIGWDYSNLQAATEILAGKLPSFYACYDHDWQTYNARLVLQWTRDDWAELFALVEESHRKLVEFLKTIPPEDFVKDRGLRFKGFKVTIAALMTAEARDEKKHCEQVEEFQRRGRLEP